MRGIFVYLFQHSADEWLGAGSASAFELYGAYQAFLQFWKMPFNQQCQIVLVEGKSQRLHQMSYKRKSYAGNTYQ
ncbi:MAG: hypothetical protein O3B01_21475 [Planctomycetota bacterium]|nr:hypothetical protein [Planctomycetota bacterium]MDA1141145.1 hypothetical protein [Planctomycetota bacterium]